MVLPEIILSSGILKEGQTIELKINFSGDELSFLHPIKKWVVFAEKNIRYSTLFQNGFYYNEGEGDVYEATNANNIIIKNLIPGRLFTRFSYKDFFGNIHEIQKVFKILPKTNINIDKNIVKGDIATFSTTSTLNNIDVTWSFTDDNSSGSGVSFDKQINVDGYYLVTADIDYSFSNHSNGDLVVWETNPIDKIPHLTDGPLAGGIAISAANTFLQQISGVYLSKFDLNDVLDLNVEYSKSVENTLEAPLGTIFTDNSTYSIGVSGDNRIEFTELDFGDNERIKGVGTDFSVNKVYKRSGEYFGTYTVNTIHSNQGWIDYRQQLIFKFNLIVTPFFEKWFKDHLSPKIFKSRGFDDIANAWGIQMDRVYNETQTLIDSIDIEKIDNKFIRHFSATYGDFPEIYNKIGFLAFTQNKNDRYNFLTDYNFFDRLESGSLTKEEKQEFLNYIQSSRNRLSKKGTPISIERALASFGLIATVKELWTDSFEAKTLLPIKDEVFSNNVLINNTGLKYRTVFTPLSDNINQPIINSIKNSYIEIDTDSVSSVQYYTTNSNIKVINGIEYIEFSKEFTEKLIKLIIDSEEIKDFTKVIEKDNIIYVSKILLSLGDKITLVYNKKENNYNETVFLSVDNKNLYKNLALETEIEFVKQVTAYEKNIELIVRAVNKKDKTYTADEYYVFGVQDSYFYFAKVAYHVEGKNSYAYKILYNLNNNDSEIVKYFIQLNKEQQKQLFLNSEELKFENKYKLRCDIKDNLISFRIKNTSKIESMETVYPWVTIFENADINQQKEEVSVRNDKLDIIVNTSEPFNVIVGKGLYGLTIPNSQLKLHRFEVIPFDDDIDINYFDDITYSKEVTTDFSAFYKNNQILKLNSTDSIEELKNSFKEFEDVKNNNVEIQEIIQLDDIIKIQMNNVNQNINENYEDRFVDIKIKMSKEHEFSTLIASIDNKLTENYGQQEEYFELNELTDGISDTYELSNEIILKLQTYPNAKIGDLIIEIDKDIVFNDFKKVGIKTNLNKFITTQKLEELYNGKSFFMETFFRGEKKYFEMGALGNNRFIFGIDDMFTHVNDSYDSLWKFNLATFVEDTLETYKTIDTVTNIQDLNLNVDFNSTTTLPLVNTAISGTSGSSAIGFAFGDLSNEQIEILSNKTKTEVLPNFVITDINLDSDIKLMLEEGEHVSSIRNILDLFQNLNFPEFKDLFLNATRKDNAFFTTVASISGVFGGNFDEYITFRKNWFNAIDFNSHISTAGIFERNFYTTYDRHNYSVDVKNNKIVFIDQPPPGKKMVLRLFYDNFFTLTNNYVLNDEYYFIPEGIKNLTKITNNKRGVVDIIEFYDSSKYNVIEHNDISFVILPKSLNENDTQLYADIEICSPFVESNENVTRIVKAPLKKVSVFLANDFESSIDGKQYLFNTNISENTWNREDDFFNFNLEFQNGNGIDPYNFSFPKVYPIHKEGNINEYFFNDYILINNFFNGLLNNKIVENDIIDQYLDVNKWYNVYNNKLGPFYRQLLKTIIEIKSYNRYYTNKQRIKSKADPFILGNWFDGFYSGNKQSWVETTPSPLLDFGKYKGSPWGTQNSRKQMIDQIRNTLNDKFPDFEIYYVDLSNFINYQGYTTKGLDSNFIDKDKYPDKFSKQFFIDNPYINEKFKLYKLNQTVTDNTGLTLFQSDSFATVTDNIIEYPKQTQQAYGNIKKINFSVKNIVRPINNGIDMYWNFDSGILFSSRQNNILPEGTEVNAEFEYSKKNYIAETNFPTRVIEKVNLGRSNGKDFQKFSNPKMLYSKNIKYSSVHRVWLDNYIINNFDVFNLINKSKITLNYPKTFNTLKDVSVLYKASNYFDLKITNIFLDSFNDAGKRDFIWLYLTRDKKGYLKKSTTFKGYVTDRSKKKGEFLFHLDDIDETKIKTSGIGKSTDVIKPISTGNQEEDIVALTSLKRNNNFELSVDILFDDIDRNFMKTDIIFRGKFNNINNKQYFNEFYSLTLGLGDSAISLISRTYNNEGIKQEQLLASVNDSLTTIKRNQFYTIKIRLVKDDLFVFFNERLQEEKFYFSYNLRKGHNTTGLESVAEKQLDGLNVNYEVPSFYINGNRIGIRSLHQGVNFSNFKITALEEGNVNFENGLEVNNYDTIISKLQKTYGITGQYKKFKRTSNGYECLQIGTSLFYRQNGGTYALHRMVVEDFEIIQDKIYVRERILDTSEFNIINVYEKNMKLIDNIIVDGIQFINEPILSYLVDSHRIVSKIEQIDGRLFIVTEGNVTFAQTWNSFGDSVWVELQSPWITYG